VKREKKKDKSVELGRRNFLKISAASSLGLLLGNLPSNWVGGVYAADAPETT